MPEAAAKTEVVDCGVDLERFSPRDSREARAEVGWVGDGTGFLCLGALSERKNVLRLARAFEQRGEGTLTFVGDGPLRAALAGRPGIELAGRVAHDEVPAWIAASDVVCQPSLVEPFGLATLEAMASARSVVATRMGGPPEFVTPESGVLVDPEDDHALTRRSPRLPRFHVPTSRPALLPAITTSSCRRHGWRRFSSEPFEIGEPDLDQRTNRVLEARIPRHRESLLVRLADLLGRNALLQPVVAGDEQLLDPARVHRPQADDIAAATLARVPWLQIFAVIQVLLSAFLVTLVLMHSGREAGMGGLGFTPHSQGERTSWSGTSPVSRWPSRAYSRSTRSSCTTFSRRITFGSRWWRNW